MRFLSITKPGIIFGNTITLIGGFLLAFDFISSPGFKASSGIINNSSINNFNINIISQGFNIFGLLFVFLVIVSMGLIIASGCVFNNYIDADIDKMMSRTKNRVTAQGLIPVYIGMIYAVFLGVLGFGILFYITNLLTVLVAAVGYLFYVVLYSLYFKRNSVFGTLIGGVSGAVPPVVGYCAVTNRLDLPAVIIFVMLFLWQSDDAQNHHK